MDKSKEGKTRDTNKAGSKYLLGLKRFFVMQRKVMEDLFSMNRCMAWTLLMINFILIGEELVNLKFIEFITDDIYLYLQDETEFRSVLKMTIFFLLGMLFFVLIQNSKRSLELRYQAKIKFIVGRRLTKKLSRIPYEMYETASIYDKLKLANKSGEMYSQCIYALSESIRIFLQLVLYSYFLIPLGGMIFGVVIIAVFLCAVLSANVTGRQIHYWEVNVSPASRRNAYFRELQKNRVNQANIQNTRSICFFLDKYRHYNNKEAGSYVKLNLYSFWTDMILAALFFVLFVPITLMTAGRVAAGDFSVGYFSLVITMLGRLYSSTNAFLKFAMNQDRYLNVMSAYYEVLSLPEAVMYAEIENDAGIENDAETEDKKIHIGKDFAISVHNLHYTYAQSEKEVLKGISVKFSWGEKIAIVGLNGSGKTTFILNLCGLLFGQGVIQRGTMDFAVIFQEFVQYQMTIKENIETGRSGRLLTEQEIGDILKKVELYDEVCSLPDGMYTKLGQLDKGVELSKGQWQRLAIARLLANEEAEIWILDEPTAFLDPLAELELYKLIFSLAGNRLVFFISHRLGFAKNADRILVMKDGKICEEGTHYDLMQCRGEYAKLYGMQEQWYI